MQEVLNITSQQSLKEREPCPQPISQECRICLSYDDNDLETLISPCNCSGTLKFVHVDCLTSWIQKIIQNSKKNKQMNDTRAFICCQLCKSKILFLASESITCRSLSEIKQGFKKSYKLFIALFLLVIINLAFFAALLNYLLFIGLRTLSQNNGVLVSLIIAGQVIFSIVALVTLSAMVKIFVFKKSMKIQLNIRIPVR